MAPMPANQKVAVYVAGRDEPFTGYYNGPLDELAEAIESSKPAFLLLHKSRTANDARALHVKTADAVAYQQQRGRQ